MDGIVGGTLESDYEALRERCGVIDRSERGKLALSGSGAVEFLNGQVTNELSTLRPGEGCYAAFLTHKGKMLGDLRVLAVGDDAGGPVRELLLDTERSTLQAPKFQSDNPDAFHHDVPVDEGLGLFGYDPGVVPV